MIFQIKLEAFIFIQGRRRRGGGDCMSQSCVWKGKMILKVEESGYWHYCRITHNTVHEPRRWRQRAPLWHYTVTGTGCFSVL
jgi:hypothetical protein